jgi:hypothetical protein
MAKPKQSDQKRKPSRGKRPSMPTVQYFDWTKFEPSMFKPGVGPSIVEELITYRDRLQELLKHEGSYVVIKGKDYVILPDREAALEYAITRYGDTPFLVKKIAAKEMIHSLGGVEW